MEKVQYFSFLSEIGKIGKSLVFFRKNTAYTIKNGIKRLFLRKVKEKRKRGSSSAPLSFISSLTKARMEKLK
nr:MAG TPA: hypothetical protein [Caudoviricetes sp.]DAR36727.1 MAG TPA: hypothetical protein [Caudoviricetes sp.]